MSNPSATLVAFFVAGSNRKTNRPSSSFFSPFGVPYLGSVNQIVPSDFTTTSLGLLNVLPSNESTSVTTPSNSVRVTRRVVCSQLTSFPLPSRVLPLVLFELSRNVLSSFPSHFINLF